MPGGARRTISQKEWLAAVLAAIAAAGWYANRVDNYTAVVRVYANWMDWTDRTTRPTHARVHELAVVKGRHVSERTIKRVVAWLHQQKYMGTVTPGMIPRYRPGVPLALDPGNEAAEYVLTIPSQRKRPLPRAGDGSAEFGPPSMSRQGHSEGPHTREAEPGAGTRWCLADRPKNRSETEAAAEAMRQRCAPLARLSDRHVAAIARPWLAAGWTPADVLHALDWQPPHHGGRRWKITAGIAAPGPWATWRLAHWRHADGTIATPASQLAAQADARRRAEQASQRAAQAAAEAARLPDHAQAQAAAAARRQLAAAAIARHHPAGVASIADPADVGGPSGETPRGGPAAGVTEPPGDGPALARALLAVTSPAERDAIVRAFRDRRRADADAGERVNASARPRSQRAGPRPVSVCPASLPGLFPQAGCVRERRGARYGKSARISLARARAIEPGAVPSSFLFAWQDAVRRRGRGGATVMSAGSAG